MGKNYGLRLMVTTQFFEWFFCGMSWPQPLGMWLTKQIMGIGIFLLNCLPNQQKLYIFVTYDNCFFKLSWLLVFATHSWVVFLWLMEKKAPKVWGSASTSSATGLRELRSQTFGLCSATGVRLSSANGFVNFFCRRLVFAQPPGFTKNSFWGVTSPSPS